MHGCGNDYIYVDAMRNHIDDPNSLAVAISNRHTGVGSDGLVLIGRATTPDADFSMRIFNADGSEAMMCGNASRCIGKYLFERKLTQSTTIRLQTLSGIKTLVLHQSNGVVSSVTVDMLEPALCNAEQFVPQNGLPSGTFVSMGNPHYVIFTNNVDEVGVHGPLLECHPSFPQRCNIEFAHVEPSGAIRTRVWERGSGITMACGTGACATAVAAVLNGYAQRNVQIIMDGGELNVEWREADNHVYMTGPAAFVCNGEWKIEN